MNTIKQQKETDPEPSWCLWQIRARYFPGSKQPGPVVLTAPGWALAPSGNSAGACPGHSMHICAAAPPPAGYNRPSTHPHIPVHTSCFGGDVNRFIHWWAFLPRNSRHVNFLAPPFPRAVGKGSPQDAHHCRHVYSSSMSATFLISPYPNPHQGLSPIHPFHETFPD